MIKYVLFALTLMGTISVWMSYFEARDQRREAVAMAAVENGFDMADGQSREVIEIPAPKKAQLTNNFWKWEAQGRLTLIDFSLDDEALVSFRQNWQKERLDQAQLLESTRYLIDMQNKAYGVEGRFEPAELKFIPLRGDANGLYVPQEQVIYLNTRMKWDQLPFERFVEVIFHENMHHIMTRMGATLDRHDFLFGDFASLTRAAYFHGSIGMAQDSTDLYQTNPQELVAWKTQRAARYVGIFGSDLDALEMTARLQEIRRIRAKAGF